MEGLVFFSAGMGRKIQLKNRYSILFQWSISHITARINYQIFGSQNILLWLIMICSSLVLGFLGNSDESKQFITWLLTLIFVCKSRTDLPRN